MKILKNVIRIGNGAAVYVPREYFGKQVIVILPEGILEIKKKIIERLSDYMANIVGVYIFGSYARGESNSLSDIDLIIITQKEQKELKYLFEDMDARVMTLNTVRKSIQNMPVLILPLLKEAKTIINPILIEELKNSRINYAKFKWNFEDIKEILKTIEIFIEADEEDISISHLYSLFMRVRVCYMIDGLLNGLSFNNKGLRTELVKRGLDEKKYLDYYEIYRRVRSGEEVDGRIDKEEILFFINLIRQYAKELENETRKKIRERN